jgi:NAD(P)-dependent dehydrogenase (short-subunit alcohol dehydrogenase family)
MGELEGKVFIIAGGGRGIGRAAAVALTQAGASVMIDDLGCDPTGAGHDENVARAVAEELAREGAQVAALALDMAAKDSPRLLVEATLARFGRIDGGFYCAGFLRERALVRLNDEDFDAVLDVHVRGAIRFAREVAKALIEKRQPGSIVLTAAPSGLFGPAGQVSLAAASGAIAAFVRSAASELRRQNIRVNAIAPTARTRLTEQLPLFSSIRADSMTAEHVAPVVAHLLADASASVHGEVLGVAGGRVYALRMGETSGLFQEGEPMTLGTLSARFREVTRA